jgi:hypothetical protein
MCAVYSTTDVLKGGEIASPRSNGARQAGFHLSTTSVRQYDPATLRATRQATVTECATNVQAKRVFPCFTTDHCQNLRCWQFANA